MFNVAIIKKNKIGIDMDEISKNETSLQYLRELIKDSIVFVDVESTDEMMHLIVNTIGLVGQNIASTLQCSDSINNIYQLCHLNRKRNNMVENDDDINYLSSFLNTPKELIYGDSVFIKSTISQNGICVPTNINLDEIVTILHNKLIPTCVLIKTDGSIDELKFFNNPITDVLKRNMEEFDSIEVPILDHNLIVFFEKDANSKLVNKKASKLIGTSKIYGSAVIVLMDTENSFGSIDKTLIKKLLTIASGDISTRDLTEDEKKTNEADNGLPIIMNKHIILEKRLSEYKYKCCNPNCESLGAISNICTGCYRVNYCSKECQTENWSVHKNTCNYGKDYLNK